jgi:hypothetical protein
LAVIKSVTTSTPFGLLTASLCVLGAQLLLAGAATHATYIVVSGRVADKRGATFGDGTDSYKGIHLVGSTTEYMTPDSAVAALAPGDEVTLWVGHNDSVQEIRIESGQLAGKLYTTETFRVTSSQLAATDAIRVVAGAVSLGIGVVLMWLFLTAGRWHPTKVRSAVEHRWREVAIIHPARSIAQLGTTFAISGLIFWPLGLWLIGSVEASGGFGPTGPNFPMGELGLVMALPDRAALLGLVGGVAGLISLAIGPRKGIAYWALGTGFFLAAAAEAYRVLSAFVIA